MNIYLVNHNHKNPMQEIIHAFSPQSELTFCADEPKQGDYVISTLKSGGETATVTTEICLNGKLDTETTAFSNFENNLESNAVKLGYYTLARKVYGYDLPWGSLTGIRPAKIAENLILAGKPTALSLSKTYYVSRSKAELATQCAVKGLEMARQARGISLYISIPFCPSRCLYCSFISTPVRDFARQINPYISLLIREIEHTANLLKHRNIPIDTVYIGGGTPTILDIENLQKLLYTIGNSFTLDTIQEFTVEAGRPDTITKEKLTVLKDFGISRISINPQTLNDQILEKIGRKHTAADFAAAFETARECGFDNINTDIIAGLPDESEHMFTDSLSRLLQYRPESLTVHALSVKRASRLKSEQGINGVSSDKTASNMVDKANEFLHTNGYAPYYLYRQKDTAGNLENVGYSLTGRECLYNVLMMNDVQSIIAMGAGGVTKIIDGNRIERIFNFKNPVDYITRFNEVLERKGKAMI